ncbi:hypothetical protein CEP51_003316 [Fusarium floridanum]|uniref:Uncharacterized protein n=1 Tax=Fusarium floridanum TaxID=1325733 RepID=A0A428S6E0_9HYPO|nr:hypothetical protein CEP51_003316 [Fusarium floridanum]
MDPDPTRNANVGITTQSVASIDLDASQYTFPPPSDWREQERQSEYERKSRAKASQWVNGQDSSRPDPGVIINSLSLDERMRQNDKIVGLVTNILHQASPSDTNKHNPSPIQTTAPFAFAARRNLSQPASVDGNTFQDRLLGFNPSFQASEPAPSFADRNSKYHDTGHHDEGRPPDTRSWHPSLSLQTTPPTRGVKEEYSPRPNLREVHWASTNPSETDTCSITRKQPKRQNSRLTDDEQGTRRRQKRHRTGLKGRLPRSPAVPDSSNSSRHAGRARQQTQREPQSQPGSGPSNASSFQDDRAECSPDCQFSEKNFIGSEETCFFWLHNNAKYSTPGRTACQGRKIEISHIVTHAVDHHGLIRARDPRYVNRGYLMSCRRHDPETKATGNCGKCKSLHEWRDADFDDQGHHGMTLCLRCWCGFTKRDMKEHLAGPLCSYMAEQPKSMKVYILYTTFCSKDDPPSAPPKFETPSHGRKPTKGRNRSATRDPQSKQQRRNQRTDQPSQDSPNGSQFRSLQPTGKANKPATSRRPASSHLEVPAQNPSRLSKPGQRPPSQSLSLNTSWGQAATRGFQPQPPLPRDIYRQVRQSMSQEVNNNNLALSSIPMRQSSSHGQSFQPTNMQQSLSDSQNSLRQPAQSAHQSPIHEVSQQFDDEALQQLLQSIEALPNQRGLNSLAQLGYQDPTNQQFFGNFIYTGNFQDSSMPRIQATSPIDNFNLTPYSQHSPSQATASQVPSTMGEPLPIPSPDMNEPDWLPDLDDDDEPVGFFQHIGSNPALQESIGQQNTPIRQQTLRPQDSSPNGLISFSQQVKIERDSAYESMEQDRMEIEGQDLARYFDFEGACEGISFTSQEFL